MQYVITFLEGVISFISPCMLPMLPIYISYFAGGSQSRRKIALHAAMFILGFTLIFSALGLFAGTLGAFLARYRTWVNIVCGVLVIIFGLNYLDVIKLPVFRGMRGGREIKGAVSALMFGVVYSVSLTPCVGAFLGSALMLASSAGGAVTGLLLLLTYSLGLGVPFFLSALLISRLNAAFGFIKAHYRVINIVCGIFLIVVGLAMAFGWLNALLALFA